MDVLELVAKKTAPVDSTKAGQDDVLQSFHSIRDNHVFKVLATIVRPDHSTKARSRALDDLPRRTKALGATVSEWVDNLVKRCAMGDSINSTVIDRCIFLAKECLDEEDVQACGAFLAAAKVAIDIFPSICTSSESSEALSGLFGTCRAASGDMKKELQDLGVFTALSSLLSKVVAVRTNDRDCCTASALKDSLIQLCTRDGTPEQARNAVYALARLVNPDVGTELPASNEMFDSLLQTLTTPSKLRRPTDENAALKVVSVLSALSAVAESAPLVMTASPQAEKAFKFALESIILGQDDDDESDSSSQDMSPSKPSRRATLATPRAKRNLLENEDLSATCRLICAGIQYLVSFVRASSLFRGSQQSKEKGQVEIRRVFRLLCEILEDHGLPPSSRDSKLCKTRSDRAALRLCAATSLIRLCDARLGLEKEMLSPPMWHTLGKAFTDEEAIVRDTVISELAKLYGGSGCYGMETSRLPPKAPSLRILSYAVLCDDKDLRTAVGQCVVNMRIATEAAYTHCCAMGTEHKFETQYKMLLMPEYCMPFAFHLLSHRREVLNEGQGDDDASIADEGAVGRSERFVRKRLKFVLDPLIQSLGGEADNISFLLRMAETLHKYYIPVDVAFGGSAILSGGSRRSLSTNENDGERLLVASKERAQLLDAGFRKICAIAIELLPTYVKTDANLTAFLGLIQLPNSLFKRRNNAVHTKSASTRAQIRHAATRDSSVMHSGQSSRRSVTFSPDIAVRESDAPSSRPSNERLHGRESESDNEKSIGATPTRDATPMLSLKSSSGASTVTLSQNQGRENSPPVRRGEANFSGGAANRSQRLTSASSSNKAKPLASKKVPSKAKRDTPPRQIEVTKLHRPKHIDKMDVSVSHDSENQPTSQNSMESATSGANRNSRRQTETVEQIADAPADRMDFDASDEDEVQPAPRTSLKSAKSGATKSLKSRRLTKVTKPQSQASVDSMDFDASDEDEVQPAPRISLKRAKSGAKSLKSNRLTKVTKLQSQASVDSMDFDALDDDEDHPASRNSLKSTKLTANKSVLSRRRRRGK
jgi:hypothetical protein